MDSFKLKMHNVVGELRRTALWRAYDAPADPELAGEGTRLCIRFQLFSATLHLLELGTSVIPLSHLNSWHV